MGVPHRGSQPDLAGGVLTPNVWAFGECTGQTFAGMFTNTEHIWSTLDHG